MNLSPIPEYAHHVPLLQFRIQLLLTPFDLEYCSVYLATDRLVEGDIDALPLIEKGDTPSWATHVAVINRSKT